MATKKDAPSGTYHQQLTQANDAFRSEQLQANLAALKDAGKGKAAKK